ncbi:hypothetical protein Naga_100001g166 [Nannochloropsis gaditana]|uniref:Uncharacterized protein n=1 Tax=Nannochloropsis gaditana TaxID=72520 RepID=W7U1C6_9STRA|nr:hypothetical protein Naga_100001g166 [Nannochloropsis gaditana]
MHYPGADTLHNFPIVDGIRLALPSFESFSTRCIEAVRTSCLQLNRPASYLLQAYSLVRATTLKHIWHQTIPVLVGWRKTLQKVCWSQHVMRRRPRKKSPSLLSSHHQTRRNGRETRRRRITKPFFAVLSTFTVLLSLVSVAYNLYLIATKDKDTNSILPRIHRGFAIVLAFPAILNESGIKWWRKLCPILSNFFVRGFFYCLIACLSIEDFSPSSDNVMGFVFLSLGLFYVALGMLCVRRHVEIT